MRLVTMCRPFFSANAEATPLMARLLDSVLPEVKMNSSGIAPRAPAIVERAASNASLASIPMV